MYSITYTGISNNINNYNMLYQFQKINSQRFLKKFSKLLNDFNTLGRKSAFGNLGIAERECERFCPKMGLRFGTYVAKVFYPKNVASVPPFTWIVSMHLKWGTFFFTKIPYSFLIYIYIYI